MFPMSKGLASCAVVAALSSAAGAQGLVIQKNIPLAMAQTIANAAFAQCESMGYKVSVVVVDRDGLPVVMIRGDGTGLHTPEGADRKAYTARIGAVGVSGSPGKDDVCSQAGIDKVADQLK